MRKHALLFISLLTAFACVREETVDTGVKTFDCFTVSVEDSPMTKVHMEDGGAVKWDVGDCIGVYSDMQAPVPYYRGEDGKFYGEKVSGKTFYAFYPYSERAYDSENPSIIKYNLWDSSSLPMVAKSKENRLVFKQTCGILHFAVYGEQKLKSIQLLANDQEVLEGEGVIDLEDNTPIFRITDENHIFWRKYTCQNPVLLSITEAFDVYFILPPMKFSDGFSVELQYEDGVVSKTTFKPVTISRSVMTNYSVDVDSLAEEDASALDVERESLVAFYNALDGPNWINKENWCSERPVGEWYGITTNGNGRVTEIALSFNNLNGTIPQEIGVFSKLKILDLQHNLVSGELPPGMGNLTDLQSINLIENRISGIFPSFLRNLKKMQYLSIVGSVDSEGEYLDYEYLHGPIPEWVGELTNLVHLELCNNLLSGPVPSSISSLKKLTYLDLGANRLTGTLPELDDMPMLQNVWLQANNFSGSVPGSYAKLFDNNHFRDLWINLNQLSGEMPQEILNHPLYCEFAYMLLARQKEGYGITVDVNKIPACRHIFETLDGNTLDLGAEYAKSDYTMIVRWAEWCPFSKWFTPMTLKLAKKYENKGLQTVWAYAGGDEAEREKYMHEVGLDQMATHIVESYNKNYFGFENDHAVWNNFVAYGTPFVEIVNNDGYIVFLDSEGRDFYTQYPFTFDRTELESFLSNLFDGDSPGGEETDYESIDYSADGTIHTLQTASEGNGINVVLMGDAFSDRLIADGTYKGEMQKAMDALFGEEPYKSHRDYFNVYYVDVVSTNEVFNGMTALNTWYGVGTHVGGNDDKVFEYARKILTDNQINDAIIIVIMNRDYYAGTCYMYYAYDGDYGRGPSIAYLPTSSVSEVFNGTVSHEAGGHGFAKLADEYSGTSDNTGGFAEEEDKASYNAMAQYGYWKNVDFTNDPEKVKWAKFIADDRYASENIGVYEGACTFLYGAWRPTENSIMRNNDSGFNAPSREAIYYRIHKLAYGADWQYNYEDFVTWDLAHRTPAAPSARSARTNFVERTFEPLAPPVVVKKDWRELVRNGR